MPETLPYWRLSGFYFCYFAFLGAFSPYWGLYLKSLSFSALQIGVLMSVLQTMRIFAPTLWGWHADRTGRRIAIVRIAAFLSLASFVAIFFGTSFNWLFASLLAMGFFWSASLPLIEATTLGHLKDDTAKYGKIRSWGSVGFIVAVIGLGYLLDRLPIGILPWAILLVLFGIFFFSRKIPESEPHPVATSPVALILKRPEVIALFASCFLMAAAHGPYYTFYSIYLVDHGYAKSSIGWLWGIGVICEIGVFFAMPRLMSVFSLKQILGFSLFCAVLRFLLIGWEVDTVALVIAAQVLHAATFGSHHAAAMASVHRIFRGAHEAKGQAFYSSLVYGAGGTVGGLGGGMIWQALGPAATFSASSILAAIGLVWLIAKFRL